MGTFRTKFSDKDWDCRRLGGRQERFTFTRTLITRFLLSIYTDLSGIQPILPRDYTPSFHSTPSVLRGFGWPLINKTSSDQVHVLRFSLGIVVPTSINYCSQW